MRISNKTYQNLRDKNMAINILHSIFNHQKSMFILVGLWHIKGICKQLTRLIKDINVKSAFFETMFDASNPCKLRADIICNEILASEELRKNFKKFRLDETHSTETLKEFLFSK